MFWSWFLLVFLVLDYGGLRRNKAKFTYLMVGWFKTCHVNFYSSSLWIWGLLTLSNRRIFQIFLRLFVLSASTSFPLLYDQNVLFRTTLRGFFGYLCIWDVVHDFSCHNVWRYKLLLRCIFRRMLLPHLLFIPLNVGLNLSWSRYHLF